MKYIFSGISYIIGLISIYFAIAPYTVYGIKNVGSVVLFLTGVFFILLPNLLYKWIKKNKIIRGIVLTAFGVFFILSGFMFWAGYINTANPNENSVLIVLGAKTTNGRPSLILRKRLEKAKEFCDDGFEGKIIVCGKSPESDTMKNYLEEIGVDGDRILLETQSTSTEENLFYASIIIKNSDLPTDVAIATDDFHQLRGKMFAERCGLQAKSVSSDTPYLMRPVYWLRDMAGVVVAMIKSL